MKHIQGFNENSFYIPKNEIVNEIPVIKVKDLIEYLEKFGLDTQVKISGNYTNKGTTTQEIIENSGWIHQPSNGNIVITGI